MVRVQAEPNPEPPLERCCFCRKQTNFWTLDAEGKVTGKSVACCEGCAKVASPEDVPAKRTWYRREMIAGGRTPGKYLFRDF